MSDHQQEIEEFGNNNDFWLFGYGSLIWKPPPHFDQRVPGYIEGYVRRFWQASEDHRGTPQAPGRVVTLIDKAHWDTLTDHHASTERVWGAAYHIPSAHVASVREYLDIREINGYSIQFTPFRPAASTIATATSDAKNEHDDENDDGNRKGSGAGIVRTRSASVSFSPNAAIKCLVYIGLPSNPQFLGPQDPDALARKILESKGPSGENKEYLYNLETALLGLSKESEDAHISDLVRRCREIEEAEGKAVDTEGEDGEGEGWVRLDGEDDEEGDDGVGGVEEVEK